MKQAASSKSRSIWGNLGGGFTTTELSMVSPEFGRNSDLLMHLIAIKEVDHHSKERPDKRSSQSNNHKISGHVLFSPSEVYPECQTSL